MTAFAKTFLSAVLAVAVLATNASLGQEQEISKKFGRKEVVKVCTVSGDCVVSKGESDEIEVVLVYNYTPGSAFDPKFRASASVLQLEERMYGTTSGSSTWRLKVPETTDIEFESASGGLSISCLRGRFVVKTASGDIEVVDCRGKFHVSSASGDVGASGVVIEGKSTFTSASGAVNVQLAESSAHDLHLDSASGKAMLDYCGNPIKGRFELTAKVRQGDIVSPFEFDAAEKFYHGHDLYVRKSFIRDAVNPRITLETASGRAILRQ